MLEGCCSLRCRFLYFKLEVVVVVIGCFHVLDYGDLHSTGALRWRLEGVGGAPHHDR